MSITRVFDEIESMKIPVLDKKGKFRRYIQYGTKKEIWEVIEPFLRSPFLLPQFQFLDLPYYFLAINIWIKDLSLEMVSHNFSVSINQENQIIQL